MSPVKKTTPTKKAAPSAQAASSHAGGANPWFAVSMGLFGLIVGYGLATGFDGANFGNGNLPGQVAPTPSAPTPSAPTPSAPTPVATAATADDDAVMGDSDAKVTLIEFTDYQCPFCARFYTQSYPLIKKNYIDTGKIKYVVRDFPLGFHNLAQITSEATECAGEQSDDGFWAMHDLIFDRQGQWAGLPDVSDTLKGYAAELGLDTTAFNSCLDNGDMADEVKKDLADGSASGVSGTPGFWVVGPDGKGVQISGAQPYTNFEAAIEELL